MSRRAVALARAAASAAGAAAGGATLEVPDEFDWAAEDYSDGTTINGTTSRSGHTMVGNFGADSDAAPVVINSPLGGRAGTIQPVGTDSVSVYMYPSDYAGGAIVYQRAEFQFDATGASTDTGRAGVMAWNDPSNPGTADGAPHQVIARDEVENTIYSDGVEDDSFDTLPQPDTGTAIRVYEHAIVKSTGACVVRGWDGTTMKFTDPMMTSVSGMFPTFQWHSGGGNPLTDKELYLIRHRASSIEGMDAEQVAYYQALIAEEGETYTPPEPVEFGFVDVQYIEDAPLATPCSMTITNNEVDDLLIGWCLNATGATIPDAPASGPAYTTPTNGTISGASGAGRVATKLVTVAGSESSGNWSSNADAELLAFIKERGFTVGVCASATGTSATISFPALSGFTSGSYVLLVAYHESASADLSGAPADFVNRWRITTSDYNAVVLDNTDGAGVASFAGATLNGGNSDAYKSWSVELIPAP